jgi:tRNA pseudouridine32 synthase / 23S rRNA pseudouridine746 synthase
MSKSDFPSIVTISSLKKSDFTIFEFLCSRFPKISPSVWQKRIESANILYEDGKPAEMRDIAIAGSKIFYYREVETETIIPFKEKILYRDDHFIAIDKPHFLPVIPAGKFVNETLLSRVKKSTGLNDIVAVNRLDRETAGIVLLSINSKSRDAYYNLFRSRLVNKVYKAISNEHPEEKETRWKIENRLVQGEPWFRMKCSEEKNIKVNAITAITLDKRDNGLCYFTLHPETGQKHQLRMHMSLIGYPVLNDRFYPVLFPEEADDYTKPLKLLSEKISFMDPVTDKLMEFRSEQKL